jgi:hypothetical protein
MAVGGAVVGRGQKGVDSELRLLAPGEHVLTDSEVDAMGGQAAVYDFRKQLRSGAAPMGYQYAPASAPAVTARPATVAAVPAATPPVYVQNPFTGAYLLAQVGSVANGAIKSADSDTKRMRVG